MLYTSNFELPIVLWDESHRCSECTYRIDPKGALSIPIINQKSPIGALSTYGRDLKRRLQTSMKLVWFGLVWVGMVWYDLVWFGIVWYGLVLFGMVWYGMNW